MLDLSLQWRFANLPNNAKLEMVPASRSREGPENTVSAPGRGRGADPCRLCGLLTATLSLGVGPEPPCALMTCSVLQSVLRG